MYLTCSIVHPFLCQVSRAMSNNYVKVPVSVTMKEAIKCMLDNHQNCVLVVDDEDLLEGILTFGDVRRFQSKKSSDTSKSDCRFLDVCFIFHKFCF